MRFILQCRLATYDGEVIFHTPKGQLLPLKLVIPRLPVQRDWHVGLAADALDHSQPDVGDAPKQAGGSGGRRRLMQVDEAGGRAQEAATSDAAAAASFDAFREDSETWAEGLGGGGGAGLGFPSDQTDSGGWEGSDEEDEEEAPFGPGGVRPPGDMSHERAYGQPLGGGAARQWERPGGEGAGDYHDSDYGWGGQEWEPDGAGVLAPAKEGELLLDAHVLCSPTVADLDGDGSLELIVAVSYFFDKEVRLHLRSTRFIYPGSDACCCLQRYADPAARAMLPADIELSNYLATGLVVFDLASRTLKWQTHLDLSTDAASFKAYAYSPPAAADADGDGRLEIFVGTSVGFVYSFTAAGALRSGFPLQMGEVQAGVSLADLDADGRLEILAADTRGNVAVFDAATGAERWERHLASMVAQSATFADVNGDGQLDAVVPTADGRVHVLNGATGADVAHFPFATGARIMAPVTPVPPAPSAAASAPLMLIAASFDGFVYFINGKSGCADPVDVGETVYSAPLVDDVDGDGRSEVIIATMNGNVVCLATPWRHHALTAWPAASPGGSNPSARSRGGSGVFVTDATRGAGEASGDAFIVQFTIADARPGAAKAAARVAAARQGGEGAAPGAYTVVITLRVPGLEPEVTAASYAAAGTYSLALPVPRTRGHGLVTVRMQDAYGLASEDSYAVAFHVRYYRILKWLLVGPFTAMALALAAGLEGDAGLGGTGGLAGAAPWGGTRAAQD